MQRPRTFPFIFTILLLTLTGCSLFKSADKEKPGKVLMDDVIRSTAGGFDFQPLQSYQAIEKAGTASMFLPGGDEQSGPGMLLSGFVFDQSVSLEQAEEVIRKTYPQYEFGKSRPLHVDKIKGTAIDFTSTYHAPDGIILTNPGADEGEEIRGRFVVVMVSPTQQFRCIQLAPADQWNKIQPGLDKVLKSVHLFTAQP